MSTRDEIISEYIGTLAGNTATQALGLMRLVEDIEHIGYLRGWRARADIEAQGIMPRIAYLPPNTDLPVLEPANGT